MLGPLIRFQDDEDEMKHDILKNINKVGVHFDPIPFSYKAGSYGRKKPDEVLEKLEAFEPEGL